MAQRQANPADATNQPSLGERKRIPMSVPVSKLSVPEIPGFHTHWFDGDPGRIARAIQGGYQFVTPEEVTLNQTILGTATAQEANTDMGTRVSIAAGGFDDRGQAKRLYLMKIEQELFDEDQAALVGPGSRLDSIRQDLLKGQIGMEGQSVADRRQVYVGKESQIPDMFKPKNRRPLASG